MKYSLEITIVLTITLTIGMSALLLSMYNWYKCSQNTKLGREFLVKVNPFSLFVASNFTGLGNIYRKKCIKFIGIGLLSVISSFIIAIFSEITGV
ncbi:MAG: hypothetical protein ACXWT0_13960 [Methylobacter sp.]